MPQPIPLIKLFFSHAKTQSNAKSFLLTTRGHETRYALLLHFSHDGHSQLRTIAHGRKQDASERGVRNEEFFRVQMTKLSTPSVATLLTQR